MVVLTCTVFGDDSSDKDVLVEFKNAVLDPSGLLSTWTESSNHCSWHGVICDKNSKVLSLNITGFGSGHGGNFEYSINTTASEIFSCSDYSLFPFYGFGIRKDCVGINGSLFGKLVPSIGRLSQLRILSLPFNRLSGGIPDEIWDLENLQVIDLENNLLSGSWPARISGLKNLRVLNMGFNNMTGKIPDWLSSLEKLGILNLAFNPLMNGIVPGFIGRLRGVYLSMTWLEGDLPADIGEGCKLEHLDLSGNMLTGQIPASLGKCSELRSLLLFSNLLEGEIPHEFGQLQNLQVLDVSRNSLSGSIPVELGDCSGLAVLVLSNYIFNPIDDLVIAKWDPGSITDDLNFYHGEIPDGITKLPKLRVLWAPRATLEGNLPSDWGACDNLEMVNLAQNFFKGEIPIALSLCKKLRYLDLSSNKRLTGELFEELPVPCLSVFDVSDNLLSDGGPAVFHNFGGNNFTGNVLSMSLAPERLEDQSSYAFFAGGNLLSRPFPGSFFGNCNGLSALFINVSYNRMSGQLPAEISLCKSLHFLDVSANQITGPIPPGVGNLVSLVALDLSRNLFEQLQTLEILDISLNSLAGELPDGLVSLTNLIVLRLNNNKLSGQIPSGLANASLIYFNVSFNNLSGPLPSRTKLMGSCSLVGNPFLDPCLASPDEAIAAQLWNYTASRPTGHRAREKIFNTTEVAVIASVSAIITLVPALLSFFVYDPSFADYGYDFNIVQWCSLLPQQGKVKEFFAAGLWDSNHQNELEEIFQLGLAAKIVCRYLTLGMVVKNGVAEENVMYDASGVRLHAGRQAELLNQIVCEFPPEHPLSNVKPLRELLGPAYSTSGATSSLRLPSAPNLMPVLWRHGSSRKLCNGC
ncbi:hypothetical protein CCACVL1_07964 [Corchorus capsularis]|uniref:Leucine-rich repeat-containing N-terminal plant-type domain-containing protein n=1 Tax=Corchorus capsularis TaxID=210143 RepID=A0A1R3J3B1_COCAP|nr:hypothetical protein CCACVL1_07964 [Corchorus capsularis]